MSKWIETWSLFLFFTTLFALVLTAFTVLVSPIPAWLLFPIYVTAGNAMMVISKEITGEFK